ncbi:MAG: hypothetical protein A2X12_03805 [Bacteroidetes bacterium GWE2_29_8]|nr:MAG: hypothetical protein A2X12_03805 [Bacteroidetes bacterium GWE2_29_8]
MIRLFNTKGIVIAQYRLNDRNVIYKIYTRMFGLQSYILTKGSTLHTNILQPLNIVDLVVTRRQNTNFQQIKEIKAEVLYNSIPYSELKRTIMLFLSEVLCKSIKDSDNDTFLFDYISDSLVSFDKENEGFINFHLIFLIHLTKFLGFFPLNNYSKDTCIFDISAGLFVSKISNHSVYIGGVEASLLSTIIELDSCDTCIQLNINNKERKNILYAILQYYKLHIMGNMNINSRQILEEILN